MEYLRSPKMMYVRHTRNALQRVAYVHVEIVAHEERRVFVVVGDDCGAEDEVLRCLLGRDANRLYSARADRPCAVFTRFWMSTVARSGSRVRSNVTEIWLVPSLPLVEVMYFIPSAPLICCSSGIVTALSTVCALAPM